MNYNHTYRKMAAATGTNLFIIEIPVWTGQIPANMRLSTGRLRIGDIERRVYDLQDIIPLGNIDCWDDNSGIIN